MYRKECDQGPHTKGEITKARIRVWLENTNLGVAVRKILESIAWLIGTVCTGILALIIIAFVIIVFFAPFTEAAQIRQGEGSFPMLLLLLIPHITLSSLLIGLRVRNELPG